MAEVYKARALTGPRANQVVALKRLTPRPATDPQAGTLWGKLAYLAPEQLERRPLSPQVDLWGAAAILYEALTNRRAIEGASNDEMHEALREGRIAGIESLRPDVPTGLGDVVHRALLIDPSARYQNA